MMFFCFPKTKLTKENYKETLYMKKKRNIKQPHGSNKNNNNDITCIFKTNCIEPQHIQFLPMQIKKIDLCKLTQISRPNFTFEKNQGMDR